MVQALVAYGIVALAAAFVAWKFILPRDLKARLALRRRPSRELKVSPRRRPPS